MKSLIDELLKTTDFEKRDSLKKAFMGYFMQLTNKSYKELTNKEKTAANKAEVKGYKAKFLPRILIAFQTRNYYRARFLLDEFIPKS
jgi:hypothetical protein